MNCRGYVKLGESLESHQAKIKSTNSEYIRSRILARLVNVVSKRGREYFHWSEIECRLDADLPPGKRWAELVITPHSIHTCSCIEISQDHQSVYERQRNLMFGLGSVVFVNYSFPDRLYEIVITTETGVRQRTKSSNALLADIAITSSFVISIFEDLAIYEAFISIT